MVCSRKKKTSRKELQDVRDVAVTADGLDQHCTRPLPDSVSPLCERGLHEEKVLHTRAVYTSQTGEIVAEEIGDILDEFNIKDRVVAVTVDNAKQTWMF